MEVTKQLAIFLENKPGALARACEALNQDRINIMAASVVDGVDHAVVRLVLDRPDRAIHLFEEAGILVVETEVLFFEAANKPGILLDIAQRLSKAKVNIEYLYCAVKKGQKCGNLVLRPSNVKKAMAVLQDID